jgi:uncharacterized protein (DUF58 family)
MLTDPAFIRKLESLYRLARKVLGGSMQADRKSTKKGAGITFADYAEYSVGDDFRSIDWRIYARFEELIVKLFEIDEDTTIYILLDQSHSMRHKWLHARQMAAALGYIGLHCLDQVCAYGAADKLRPLLATARGRGKALPFLQTLEQADTFGEGTDFTACCLEFQAWRRRRGLVIVISDFLFPGGFEEGLRYLHWHKHDVFCLQTQDATDRVCDLKGDIELECIEAGRRERVTVTPKEVRLYEEAVTQWNASLKDACRRRGIGLISTTTEVEFEDIIQSILRRGGLVA